MEVGGFSIHVYKSTSIFNSDGILYITKKKLSYKHKDIFDKITFSEIRDKKLKLNEEQKGNCVGLIENLCNKNIAKGRML